MEQFDVNQVAEIQLIYKNTCKPSARPRVTRSREAYDILIQSWDENRLDFIEQAKVILLSRGNRALGVCEISSGGVSGTIVDPKYVFAAALKANASAIVLAHNHPSGNLTPSEQDRRLTDRFREGCRILDITFIDHLIISGEGYYSFTEDESFIINRNINPV